MNIETSPVISQHPIYLTTCGFKNKSVFLDLVRNVLCFYGLEDRSIELITEFSPKENMIVFLDITNAKLEMIDSIKKYIDSMREKNIGLIINGFSWENYTHNKIIKELSANDSILLASQKHSNGKYIVYNNDSQISEFLKGTKIPHKWDKSSNTSYFIKKHNDYKQIISGYDQHGRLCPYLIKFFGDGPPLFLLSDLSFYKSDDLDPSLVCPLLLAAFLLVRKFAGCKCWHNNNLTANFTIDDPNLVEPYGYLSYQRLLELTKNQNFHTTIAFIPWNYRRVKTNVVDMFLKYPDKLSLAIHGNNHDGFEFSAKKQRAKQKENIAEALSRMKLLKKKTNLDYSKVMIFPHWIGNKEAIKYLNEFGYLASVNRQIIPHDSSRPTRFSFGLRPAQDDVEFFPLCERWHPEDIIPELEAFFGKPLLTYSHLHNSFEDSEILNDTVMRINKLKPIWLNLAGISNNLYLKKIEKEQDHIWMFSRRLELTNISPKAKKISVYRNEIHGKRLRVLCNGEQVPLNYNSNFICFEIFAKPNQRSKIVIERDFSSYSPTSKNRNIKILAYRYISDFRDRYWNVWVNRLKTFNI